jgi:hypothetical protein
VNTFRLGNKKPNLLIQGREIISVFAEVYTNHRNILWEEWIFLNVNPDDT